MRRIGAWANERLAVDLPGDLVEEVQMRRFNSLVAIGRESKGHVTCVDQLGYYIVCGTNMIVSADGNQANLY